jgi:hypothetical protein
MHLGWPAGWSVVALPVLIWWWRIAHARRERREREHRAGSYAARTQQTRDILLAQLAADLRAVIRQRDTTGG